MSAAQVTVAKFIEAEINSAMRSQTEMTVERSYADWDRDLTNTDGLALTEADRLRVDIVSHTTEQAVEQATRGSLKFTTPIDIAVRRKFGTGSLEVSSGRVPVEEVDSLVLLTQEIHVLLTKLRSEESLPAVWDPEPGTRILANPLTKHLRELRQFTSIIRINFRVDVEL